MRGAVSLAGSRTCARAHPRARARAVLGTAVCAALLAAACGQEPVVATSRDLRIGAESEDLLPIDTFFEIFHPEPTIGRETIDRIFERWRPAYASIVIEAARFSQHRVRLPRGLESAVGERFDGDFDRAYRWLWARPAALHPDYARWKAILYEQIEPRFAGYFEAAGEGARIRLDEVRRGGVERGGIPPLDHPATIPAAAADYLDPADLVFGIEIEGDRRAYPKRILAWHELFRDVVGGVPVHGVYCTLCGTMILYKSEAGGRRHRLGTSGFLYRSNKLMYDADTESLWSTIHGAPVLGPRAAAGFRLEALSVVTTTWGAWRDRHPDTRVLSLDTGHRRDYREGAAYREYFATDELMFSVPFSDTRLRNKDEVLALRFGDSAAPTAIAVRFLGA